MSHRLPEPDKPWMMRTYAGHSTAVRSNELYRRNLAKGQTGLSIAFDLPTQTGYDADHELARGEVGKVGVPEAGELMTQIRDATAARIVEALGVRRTAVRAWLWFLDGAILDWIEHGDVSREDVRAIALGALNGAATA